MPAGAVLAFQNVDAAGAPHPKGKHLVSAANPNPDPNPTPDQVSAVPKDAANPTPTPAP
jgi:hypothetical protein